MDFGIFTFGELSRNVSTGNAVSPQQRLKEIIELAKLADQAGLSFLGLGEHHRRDFALSAPEIVLAAIARETTNLRLSSAVTVLSTQDPVRLFEQFATLDLISDGRAEIIVGRGAFVESYPLFGYELDDYDALFDEKLRLLLELRDNAVVNWRGDLTQSIHGMDIVPRPVQDKLPLWVGVGGTPASFARAGRLGLPLFVALLSGPERFRRLVEVYRQAAADAGHDPGGLQLGAGGHFYVAPTSQQARETFSPPTTGLISSRICRGRWSTSRAPPSMNGPNPAAGCWSGAHSRLPRSCWKSTRPLATAGTWPRSDWADCRSRRRRGPSNCWPPKLCLP